MGIKPKSLMKLIGAGILAIMVLIMVMSAVDRNTQGKYVVVQKGRGGVFVVSDPTFYWAMFRKTWTYEDSFEVYLSKSDEDGGSGSESQAITVPFNDKAIADVSSVTKILIPKDDDVRLQLHTEFKSFNGVKRFARSYVESVLKASGPFFKASAAYSTEFSAFESMIRNQLKDGKYATYIDYIDEPTGEVDEEGKAIVVKTSITKISQKDGLNIIADEGFFNLYGLSVRSFQLKAVDPDTATLDRINAEKDVEQERRLSKQKAETAKQRALTAIEDGKADVAEEVAKQNVIKEREVIQAQKEKEVAILASEKKVEQARLALEQSKLDADATVAAAEAKARENRLRVAAGLTPQEELEGRKYIANAVSKNIANGIAQADFPEIVISGGGEGGNQVDLMSMLGIQLATEMADKYSK